MSIYALLSNRNRIDTQPRKVFYDRLVKDWARWMMPKDPNDSGGSSTDDGNLEALLTQYREVRAETRELERGIQRQTFAAVIVVGSIFGYALSTGTIWLLLAAPVIIGYFIAIVGHTWISVMFLSFHARTIESRIDDPDFSWETKHGEIWDDNDRIILSGETLPVVGDINWSEFPKLLTIGLVGGLYASAVLIAVVVVWIEIPDPWQLQANIAAISGYGVYSVLISIVGKAHHGVNNELNRRVRIPEKNSE